MTRRTRLNPIAGLLLLASGLLPGAGRAIAASAHPNNPPALAQAFGSPGFVFQEGLRLLDEERFVAAEDAFREVLRFDPDDHEAWNNLGRALQGQNDPTAALDAYEQALALRPRYAEAFNNIGVAYRSLGQVGEAIQAYRQAIALNRQLGAAHYNIGLILYGENNLDGAIARFRQAIAASPDFLPAYYYLGEALLDADRPLEALEPLQTTLSLNPDLDDAYGALGEALLRLGRTREAQIRLDEAADRLGADDPRVVYYRGLALLETGDAKAAQPLLERAIVLDADYADAFRTLAELYLRQGSLREATELYERAIALYQEQGGISSRELARAYFGLGNGYARRGNRFPEAIAAFQNALNADPDFGLAHARMGDLLAEREEYFAANIAYEAALVLEPDSPEIYNSLGELLYTMGYFDRAVNAWRTAIELDPTYGEALTNLGDALGSGRRVP